MPENRSIVAASVIALSLSWDRVIALDTKSRPRLWTAGCWNASMANQKGSVEPGPFDTSEFRKGIGRA
jgi:hypothetical protein